MASAAAPCLDLPAASPHPVRALATAPGSVLAEAVSPCRGGPCRGLAFSSPPLPVLSAFAANLLPRQSAERFPSPSPLPAERGVPTPFLCTPTPPQCPPLFRRVLPLQLSGGVKRLPLQPGGVPVIPAADQRRWVRQLVFPGRRRGALTPPQLCTRCCPPPHPLHFNGPQLRGRRQARIGILLLPATGTRVTPETRPWLLGCAWASAARGQAGAGGHAGRGQRAGGGGARR